MRLTAILLLLLALVSCTPQQENSPQPAGFGQGVVEAPQNTNHVTIRLMFRAGSINDPADKKGLTQLTGSLVMGGGNKAHSKTEIDDILYPLAAGFGSGTDKEVTIFTTTAHVDNIDKVYEIFKGLVLEPRWDASDYERLMTSAKKAVNQDIPNNNDEVFSKRVLDTVLFEGHPYEHLTDGSQSGLESITLDDVKAHYANTFTRKNLMIGVAGSYTEAFRDRLVADMAGLPEGSGEVVTLPQTRMPEGVEARVVYKDQAFAIFMGYPLEVNRADDDFAALLIAASYLGEHRKSYGRLYKKMRGDRSLNYGDYAYVEWYPAGHAFQQPLAGTPRRSNFFSIWIRPVQIAAQFRGIEGLEEPALGNAHFSIRQAIRELDMLIQNGMSDEDFQRVRKFMSGYMKLFVQSQGQRLGYMMDSRFYGREDYINEMDALMAKLTVEDVNNAMKKYLQAENFYVSIITDASEAEPLAESIKTNGSAPIVYKPAVSAGLSDEHRQEDADIDAYKLNVTKVEVIKNDTLFK